MKNINNKILIGVLAASALFSVAVPFGSHALAATCVPNPRADLAVSAVSVSGSSASVSYTNNSANCSYPIGLASYKVFSAQGTSQFISTQTLFNTSFQTLVPHQTKILSVALPACAYQVDAFSGTYAPVPPDFAAYIHTIPLFTWKVETSISLCGSNPPPQGSAPTVQTDAATGVTQSSVQVNGSANPNGASTTCWFEYGTTYSLGQTIGNQSVGSGNSSASISAGLYGLSQNTTYYFRAVCQNSYGTGQGQILSFTTGGYTPPPPPQGSAPSVQTNMATGVGQTSAQLNGSGTANGAATTCWFEYGTTNSLGQTIGNQSIGSGNFQTNLSSALSGLTQNSTYYFRAVCQNAYGTAQGSILSFTTAGTPPPQGSAPSVQTNTATGVSDTGAQLNGAGTANGASTTCWFEYGQNNSLGQTAGNQSIGSGNSQAIISATLSGLSANTTYYFRAVCQNSYGTTHGSILSFTTTSNTNQGSAPFVQTSSASNINQLAAQLNGLGNPNGASTTCWFEYGTTNSLGQTIGNQSIGSGTAQSNLSYNISNLSQNVTYYFRAVCQNQYGISQGQILSFYSGNGGNQGSAPVAQTNSASNTSQNYATLNGQVNPNGVQTNYWFEYGQNYSLGYTTGFQSLGNGTGNFPVTAYLSGLNTYNTTYYFRVVAQNQYGTSYGQILSFTTGGNGGGGNVPLVQTNQATNIGDTNAWLNGQVNPNGSDTVTWFEYGISSYSMTYTTNNYGVGSGYSASVISQPAQNLTSNTTYYFRAVARNNNGTAYGQVLSFTTTGGSTYGNQPQVITDPATYLYQNSALLNGRVNPNGGLTNSWFEYGLTNSLGLRTQNQPAGSANAYVNYSYALSGLLPNSTYYFRAAAQNQYGTVYGSILTFTTQGTPIVNPPVTPNPPVIIQVSGGGTSCVLLIPTLDQPSINSGGEFVYTVTYRNNCPYVLSNANLKVTMPLETDFETTNYPYSSRDANTLTYSLGVIPQNFQAAIIIRGRVRSTVGVGYAIIFRSDLGYSDGRGFFQTVTAYLTATVGQNGSLTASIFDSLIGLFSSLWFWLLFILILIGIFLFWLFNREKEKEAEKAAEVKTL